MRLYLDSNAIIYSVEGLPPFREAALRWIEQASDENAVLTSQLSTLECRVKPLKDGDAELLARFEGAFQRMTLLDITQGVLDKATDLRAQHGFRTPDAIHLATAILWKADRFLTADSQLTRCPDLDVTLLP